MEAISRPQLGTVAEAVWSINPDLSLGAAAFEALAFGAEPLETPPVVRDLVRNVLYPTSAADPDLRQFKQFRAELVDYATNLKYTHPDLGDAISHNLSGWQNVLNEHGAAFNLPGIDASGYRHPQPLFFKAASCVAGGIKRAFVASARIIGV